MVDPVISLSLQALNVLLLVKTACTYCVLFTVVNDKQLFVHFSGNRLQSEELQSLMDFSLSVCSRLCRGLYR